MTEEFIFESEKYFNECHASTVLPLENGNVISAWFAGTNEGNNDVKIYVSIRENGTWTAPLCVTNDGDVPHWNPVLFKISENKIALYYKFGEKISHWQTKVTYSSDGGKTWSNPEFLVENDTSGGRGPVKNKCIRLSDGSIIAPASSEQHKQWRAFADISSDDGKTWNRQKYIVRPRIADGLVQMIQPSMWENPDGYVHCMMRTNKGYLYKSDSDDYGKTWKRAYKTTVPNNNSGIDLVKVPDGRIFLVCNPVNENWGDRFPLALFMSDDNGNTWNEYKILDSTRKELSYPAITYSDNALHITYTFARKRIKYIRIDL